MPKPNPKKAPADLLPDPVPGEPNPQKGPPQPQAIDTETPPDLLPIIFACRHLLWLKTKDLVQLKGLLDRNALTGHLNQVGQTAATQFQRMRSEGVTAAEAEKEVMDRYIAPCLSGEDPTPPPDAVVPQIRQALAEWEASPEATQYVG